MSEVDRRQFVAGLGSTMAVLGGGRGLAESLGAGEPSANPPAKEVPVIGIQIGAISFLDEGTEKVLDILQEKGGVNTLFIASFTYGNGTASRMLPGHPLPDHGVQQYDEMKLADLAAVGDALREMKII